MVKRAIIIGATSGIGKGLAKLLADKSYKLGITGRRAALLDDLVKGNPNAFIPSSFDITDISSIDAHLKALVAELGGLDLFIFSAGSGEINEMLNIEPEHRSIDINVLGFTHVVHWAFHFFEKQGYGHLVGITSVAGIRGNRSAPAYNAAKAYQINYLEGLRQKADKWNGRILVTDVRPGFVDTAMAKGDGIFWVASVDKVVQQIVAAIKRKKKVVYVTKRWMLIGFILTWLPRKIYDKF
jgi:short-subunit dehydrogenase